MKKFIVAISAIFAALVVNASPYIGVEHQFKNVQVKHYKDGVFAKKALGYHIHVGYMLSDDYSFETGYHADKAKKKVGTHKMRGIHGSFVKHISLNEQKTLYGIGSVGMTHARHNTSHTSDTESMNLLKSGLVPRLMAGLEYYFTPSVLLRTAFVFEGTSFLSSANDPHKFNDSYGINIGLRFKF